MEQQMPMAQMPVMEPATPQPQQPSYEELVEMYNSLVQSKAYDEAKTRLAFCIEVLKLKKEFPAKYVEQVTREVMSILPMDGIDPQKISLKKSTKKDEE